MKVYKADRKGPDYAGCAFVAWPDVTAAIAAGWVYWHSGWDRGRFGAYLKPRAMIGGAA